MSSDSIISATISTGVPPVAVADHAGHDASDHGGGGCGCGCGCGCGDGANEAEQPGGAQSEPAANEIDVRVLPHGQRHEIIFARLDALAPGEALVIVNDHDPKPLRYQTAAMWPDRFIWSYQQAGPQVWRVAIHCDK